MSSTPRSGLRTAIDYTLYFVGWIGFSILGFWLIVRLRVNLIDLAAKTIENPDTMRDDWLMRGIDRWAIFAMGAVWIVCIFLMEGYLRSGAEKMKLLPRLGRIGLVMGAIFLISQGLFYL